MELQEAEERHEARRAHTFLKALRLAIPASISGEADQQKPFREYQAQLLAAANGQTTTHAGKRWAPSKRKPK